MWAAASVILRFQNCFFLYKHIQIRAVDMPYFEGEQVNVYWKMVLICSIV